jgi:hypothetical protein
MPFFFSRSNFEVLGKEFLNTDNSGAAKYESPHAFDTSDPQLYIYY